MHAAVGDSCAGANGYMRVASSRGEDAAEIRKGRCIMFTVSIQLHVEPICGRTINIKQEHANRIMDEMQTPGATITLDDVYFSPACSRLQLHESSGFSHGKLCHYSQLQQGVRSSLQTHTNKFEYERAHFLCSLE